jgi:hypothetical protein|tara:strand:+ start:185 stop:358 length:174 start_codon:yes stop_codon:yes gene_type:complete
VKKDKLFIRSGKKMIAGKVADTVLTGEGAVHRFEKDSLPRGLSAVETEIWKLKNKKK